MSSAILYPWQEGLWQSLGKQLASGEVPHALMLVGPAGMGKRQFAQQLVARLLCDQPDMTGHACGQCRGCTLREAGSHPDFRLVEPEEAGKAIKVDQIRGVISYLSLTSQYHHAKIVVISPAEGMNTNAANSLLKTLEEPPAGGMLVLVSNHPASLPATIRSRCHQLRFAIPPNEQALAWLTPQLDNPGQAQVLLDMAGGAPLAALALAESGFQDHYDEFTQTLGAIFEARQDPVKVAEGWVKATHLDSFRWIYGLFAALIRYRLLPGENDVLNLHATGNRLDLRELYALLDEVTEALRLERTQINQQLLLEGLLIRWAALGAKTRKQVVNE